MKKLYYLLAIIAVVFASCDPLSQTYKNLDALPQKPGSAINITLTTAYRSISDANSSIPATLTSRYPTAVNGTPINVTFSLRNDFSNIQSPDSLTSRITYTLLTTNTPNDYRFAASTLPNGVPVPANTTDYFTSAGAINYLNYKYPTPFIYQLVVLKYTYFENGGTSTTGTANTIDTFIYLPSGWTKAYTVSAAQYASVSRGANNAFLAAATDYPNLAAYFNTFLKNDPIAMLSAKAGAVQYISYNIGTFTKIMALTYDGSNWLLNLTLPFLKLNGVWVPDPTVYYTIPATANNTDYTYLKGTTIGSDAARGNVASFGDFDIRTNGATTAWSDADVNSALSAILLNKFPKATIGVPYRVTYSVYTGSVSVTSRVFIFDGTSFVYQP